jgi:hypothetical protein
MAALGGSAPPDKLPVSHSRRPPLCSAASRPTMQLMRLDRVRPGSPWHTLSTRHMARSVPYPLAPLLAGTNKRPIKRREADVVDIKYCRDTDPTMQQSRAENQHDAAATTDSSHRSVSLMQSLRDAGYRPDKVRLHVILLGVGGTIYSSMHTTLKQLGLKRQATANVAGKLQKHATVYARRIMQTKWSQEFALKRDTG